jgi:hypothetical protein
VFAPNRREEHQTPLEAITTTLGRGNGLNDNELPIIKGFVIHDNEL